MAQNITYYFMCHSSVLHD